jgi:hypothetical protein
MIPSQTWQPSANVITAYLGSTPDILLTAFCPQINCQVEDISHQQQQTSVQTPLGLSA